MAMIAKQAWRIMNGVNPLVTALMKAKYFASSDFINAKMGNNPSYTWRSLLAVQKIMQQGSRRKIVDGKDTRVWQVPWLPCRENGYISTNMQHELENTTVHELMETGRRVWDAYILVDLFNDRDMSFIQQIPLSDRYTGHDGWYWVGDDRGDFTVKSCYRQIRGEHACEDRTFWRILWNTKLPGKMINFLWRACSNVLPTATALVMKRVNMVQSCVWCQIHNEDAAHVLFTCCFARELWNLVGLQKSGAN